MKYNFLYYYNFFNFYKNNYTNFFYLYYFDNFSKYLWEDYFFNNFCKLNYLTINYSKLSNFFKFYKYIINNKKVNCLESKLIILINLDVFKVNDEIINLITYILMNKNIIIILIDNLNYNFFNFFKKKPLLIFVQNKNLNLIFNKRFFINNFYFNEISFIFLNLFKNFF